MTGGSVNLEGRPPKFARIDHGKLQQFKNTASEVTTPDGSALMTREAAVLRRGRLRVPLFQEGRGMEFLRSLAMRSSTVRVRD